MFNSFNIPGTSYVSSSLIAPKLPQKVAFTVLDLPSDILILIGRVLPRRQDAVNYTSVCVKLFNLRFADTGFGIFDTQFWQRVPNPDEAISSIIAIPEWGQRAGGRLLRNDTPGILKLRLNFKTSPVGQELETVISRICALSKLTEIAIYCYTLSENDVLQLLEKMVVTPLALSVLFLSGHSSARLFQKIGQFSSLQNLIIKGPQIPTEVGELIGLQNLTITIPSTALPAELGQLSNLHHLTIRGNALTVIPAELGRLSNLRYLNIQGHVLMALPAELGRLERLHDLSIFGGALTALPVELGRLEHLHNLKIFGGSLTFLPAELGRLSHLHDLMIQGDALTAIPAELGQLSNLRSLYIQGNSLTSLPSELAQLNNLKHLSIDGNNLQSLPFQWARLNHLQSLTVLAPRAPPIPPEFVQFNKLRSLRSMGNM